MVLNNDILSNINAYKMAYTLQPGEKISVPVTNPIGCNIKWDGKDAHWMPADACDLLL